MYHVFACTQKSVKTSVSNNRKGVHSKIKLFVAALFVPTLELRALCNFCLAALHVTLYNKLNPHCNQGDNETHHYGFLSVTSLMACEIFVWVSLAFFIARHLWVMSVLQMQPMRFLNQMWFVVMTQLHITHTVNSNLKHVACTQILKSKCTRNLCIFESAVPLCSVEGKKWEASHGRRDLISLNSAHYGFFMSFCEQLGSDFTLQTI